MRRKDAIRLASRWCAVLISVVPFVAQAESVGRIKTTSGEVTLERGRERIRASVGLPLLAADRIVTGRDGAIGVTLADGSMLSAGPDSVLELEAFAFDPGTHEGNLDVSLERGTLSGIAGKLVERAPGAMKVRTPAAVLGVRGTEFAVRVEEAPLRRAWSAFASVFVPRPASRSMKSDDPGPSSGVETDLVE